MANKSKGAKITRRAFFRRLGLAGAAAGLASCGGGRAGADAPEGAMTCRTDPKTGRGVSLLGYDRSAPRLRQAARCIGCGQCAPKCPQGIDIPSQMRLIDGYVEQLRRAAPGL